MSFACNRWQPLALAGALLISAVPARAGDIDPYIPSDARMLLTVNVKQILGSALVKKDLGKLKDELKKQDDAQKILDSLGFDPFKDLESISLAAAGGSDDNKVLIIAHGKFDAAKFHATIKDQSKQLGDMVKSSQDNGHTLYEIAIPQGDKTMYAAIVDDTTIVAALNKGFVNDAFAVKAGKKKHELAKDFLALLEKASTDVSIGVVGVGEALAKLPQGENIKHMTGGLTLGEDIKAEFNIVTKNDQSAKELSNHIQQGLEMAKGFSGLVTQNQKELAPLADLLEAIKVSDKSGIVTIKGTLTKDDINKAGKENK